MTQIATITDIRRRLAQGKGFILPSTGLGNGSLTAATAGAGHFLHSINFNKIGTTVTSTLVEFPKPPITSNVLITNYHGTTGGIEYAFLAYLYEIGTMSVSGTTFTHSGTFTRLRRTVYNQSNTNIPLVPVYYVTTAVSGASSAPTFTFTYVDQDGNTGETSITNSLPSTSVSVESCYSMQPKTSDSAILDITAMSITANGASAGAATIFGMEILAVQWTPMAGVLSVNDLVYGGMSMSNLLPASPDSGSVTSYLAWVVPSNLGGGDVGCVIQGVINA